MCKVILILYKFFLKYGAGEEGGGVGGSNQKAQKHSADAMTGGVL